MRNGLNNVKRIVLDYVCGTDADVLACLLEGTDVMVHVRPTQGSEQHLGDRLREVFKAEGLGYTVSVRVHAANTVRDLTSSFGSGVVIYDPAGMVASLRNSVKAAANDNAPQSARWGAAAAAALVALGGLHAPVAHAEGSSAKGADGTLPAVSAPNGKVAIDYNNYDGMPGNVLSGSFSMPLGHAFGAQVDAGSGRMNGDNYTGFGGHLFWRDPSKGLVGLIGSTANLGGDDMIQVGGEAQLYLDQVTLGTRLARQHGDVDDGDVVRLDAGWYITDNVVVGAYTERAASVMTNNFSVEWQPGFTALQGLTFFASAEQGGHNADATTLGVRYYFGANKSLKDRHRQDDPPSLVPAKIYKKKRNNIAAPYSCGSCPV